MIGKRRTNPEAEAFFAEDAGAAVLDFGSGRSAVPVQGMSEVLGGGRVGGLEVVD